MLTEVKVNSSEDTPLGLSVDAAEVGTATLRDLIDWKVVLKLGVLMV